MTERDENRERLAKELGVESRQLAGLDAELESLLLKRISELYEAAAVDELTGALSRKYGLAVLEHKVDHVRRNVGEGLVVAFIDLDHLKSANDSGGHVAGDRLLQDLAGTIRSGLEQYELVIRWGGDEFVCALSRGRQSAQTILDRRRSDFCARNGYSFTYGIAEWRPGDTAEDLVMRADNDLYARKRSHYSDATSS